MQTSQNRAPRPCLIGLGTGIDGNVLVIDSLGCSIDTVYVSHEHHVCLFTLPGLSCTDMTGAIALAKTLMPGVKLILTANECGWDTAYALRADGNWEVLSGNISLSVDVTPIPEPQLIESLLTSGQYILREDFTNTQRCAP